MKYKLSMMHYFTAAKAPLQGIATQGSLQAFSLSAAKIMQNHSCGTQFTHFFVEGQPVLPTISTAAIGNGKTRPCFHPLPFSMSCEGGIINPKTPYQSEF